MARKRRKVAKALKKKGFRVEQKARDHDYFWLKAEGLTEPVYTKLSRGASYKTLGDPLLAKIRRQLKLDAQEFEDFLDCPLTESDYRRLLNERGILP